MNPRNDYRLIDRTIQALIDDRPMTHAQIAAEDDFFRAWFESDLSNRESCKPGPDVVLTRRLQALRRMGEITCNQAHQWGTA